ncbi:hypothetical protein Slin15195_G129750 [Septoria linicola]|uniref:Uncharacterized protein n=1 Tax=Septoria linicola TaxID=215465 RepID=A0A9Q9EQC0_9PEZI|nr:hypothetical protein Slin14017_G128760 [Septoria linicola]USW59656.1 hypothetical protein Slin15195_G129750 [Septoria linicola]
MLVRSQCLTESLQGVSEAKSDVSVGRRPSTLNVRPEGVIRK